MVDRDAARAALRAFLGTRRARVSPEEAGLAVIASRRRVPGLRREEVAMLAGISAEYYVRLERGQATGPSPGVVAAVARALRLDHDERAHLDRLLAELTPGVRKRRRRPVTDTVSDGVQVVLDAMPTLPAVVQSARLDVLATNALGRVLYAPVFDLEGPPNSARFLFLDEFRARELFPRWERIADDTVALLRIEASRHPDDRAMVELIGQLSTRSAAFRTRWARNDVRSHNAGVKVFKHPLVGELALPYENLLIDAAADHTLTVFTPRPGGAEYDAVQLLASWNTASRSDTVQPRER
jgi:transcriptional regulator with XRE-family HTH domain